MSHISYIRMDSSYIEGNITKGSRSVIDLFLRTLKNRLITDHVRTINISLTSNNSINLTYNKDTAGFIHINFCINPEEINNFDESKRKNYILNIIFTCMDYLAQYEKWDKSVILETFNQCLKLEIKNEWWHQNRIIRSSNHNYYLGIYNIFELDFFEEYLVLFNKEKKEIIRHLIFKDRFDTFKVRKLAWVDNNTIYFQFDGPKKIFKYTIDEILEGHIHKIPDKIHLLFK
jgi:hypothetical protein